MQNSFMDRQYFWPLLTFHTHLDYRTLYPPIRMVILKVFSCYILYLCFDIGKYAPPHHHVFSLDIL
jgi:hypothetical protein